MLHCLCLTPGYIFLFEKNLGLHKFLSFPKSLHLFNIELLIKLANGLNYLLINI
jgi:hypothetical protein